MPVLVVILETNQDSGEGLMEVLVAHLFVMPWGMMQQTVRPTFAFLAYFSSTGT